MIDPTLRASTGSLQDMLRCMHVGLLCIQESPASRPTMDSVTLMLGVSTTSLPAPSEPVTFAASPDVSEVFVPQVYRSTHTNHRKGEAATSKISSQNDMSVTELSPR